MEEPEVLFEASVDMLSKKDLIGQNVLVTAGPTREPLDPVRFLSNRSSGRMGVALAIGARRRGAQVVLITGPIDLKPPWGMQVVPVVSAAEMAQEVKKHFKRSHMVLMAAAVADFCAKQIAQKKIKKTKGIPNIELQSTQDILGALGKVKQKRVIVGFAAEWGNPVAEAKRKLKAKNLDLVVANDVSLPDAGFDVEHNQVHLVDRSGVKKLPLLPKAEVAEQVIDRVVSFFPKKSADRSHLVKS